MTSLLVAKYGNFNKSVLLTNAVYSTALAIRTAQNYGLSVKGAGASARCGSGDSFQCAYGVAFSTTDSGKFALFLDANGNGIKDTGESDISTYTLKNGATILAFVSTMLLLVVLPLEKHTSHSSAQIRVPSYVMPLTTVIIHTPKSLFPPPTAVSVPSVCEVMARYL